VTVKRIIINNTIDDHIISVQQKKLSIAAEILGTQESKNHLQPISLYLIVYFPFSSNYVIK
jgi:SNF2 family DNA or RNA helicase